MRRALHRRSSEWQQGRARRHRRGTMRRRKAADSEPGSEPSRRRTQGVTNERAPAARPTTTSAPSAICSTRCSAAPPTPRSGWLFSSRSPGPASVQPFGYTRLRRPDQPASECEGIWASPQLLGLTIGILAPHPAVLGHRRPCLARSGDAHGVAHHDRKWRSASPSRRTSPRNPSSRSARPSAAKWRQWATASSGARACERVLEVLVHNEVASARTLLHRQRAAACAG